MKKTLILLVSLLLLVLVLSGCNNSSEERKVDTSGASDTLVPLEVTNVTTMSDDTSYFGVFYEFTNNTEETIQITEMSVTYTNKDGIEIETKDSTFSPYFLKPGETGYGGNISYNESSEYNLEGVTATVVPSFSYSTEPAEDILTVKSSEITEIPYNNLSTDHKGVEVVVENTSPTTEYTPVVVCGLFDKDDNLIGFASNLGSDKIAPEGQETVICENILIYPANDFSQVVSVDPRVRTATY